MKHARKATVPLPPENGEADPQLSWVRENWTFVAAVAWTGYVDEGRGAVVVSVDTPETMVHYITASVWADPQSRALFETYDPRREVVLAIVADGDAAFHLLEGLPNPPEAVIAHPLERLRSNERHDRHAEAVGSGTQMCEPDAADDIDPNLLNEQLVHRDLLVGQLCPFCRSPLEVGDLTKWMSTGPVNRREYAKWRRGLPYVSRSPWPFHLDCGDPKGRVRLTQH